MPSTTSAFVKVSPRQPPAAQQGAAADARATRPGRTGQLPRLCEVMDAVEALGAGPGETFTKADKRFKPLL